MKIDIDEIWADRYDEGRINIRYNVFTQGKIFSFTKYGIIFASNSDQIDCDLYESYLRLTWNNVMDKIPLDKKDSFNFHMEQFAKNHRIIKEDEEIKLVKQRNIE